MKGTRLSPPAPLNEVLKAELTAINQYFLHAEMCENWLHEGAARYVRKESIEEMTHAESLMERIAYLSETPAMNELFPLRLEGDGAGPVPK